MFTPLFSVFCAFLLALSHLVDAAPVFQPLELIAFPPTIISPNSKSVWTTGMDQTVSWRTDNVPDAARNDTLTVLLGHDQDNSENLDIKSPLATEVPILAGNVTVHVPLDLPYRTNYIVVVIGTSGDSSQNFTIIPST